MLMQKLSGGSCGRAGDAVSIGGKKTHNNNNNNKKPQQHHRYGGDALDLIMTQEGDGPVVKREAGL